MERIAHPHNPVATKSSGNLISKFRNFISWIGSIGYRPNDSAELKSHKAILTIGIYVATINLLTYFPVYIGIGRVKAAITLLSLATAFTVNLICFSIHRNFRIFRDTTFIGLYFYIIIYHTVMGGYIGSTGYINYGIAALNGILIFYKTNRIKFAWFFVYLATAIILYFLDPIISEGTVPLSDSLTVIMFLNNFILISGMVMLSASYFLNIIRKEKLKSDLLIRNILPEAVVNELNENSRSSPILVPQATIVFMDFVGFTQITQSLEPHELVAALNKHFTVFDKVFKSHKVEKLKTIGDAYMAVGGLPEPNNTHPLDVALAAMRIIGYLETTAPKDNLEWKVRIGIHTGSVIAGIIGETKFSYDVWGGNVNLCSRLESAGRPGLINVSKDFMECTRDFFEFEDRGLIEVKHSEPVHMYFLKDIKSSLKAARFQPNNKFFELYKDFSMGKYNSIHATLDA